MVPKTSGNSKKPVPRPLRLLSSYISAVVVTAMGFLVAIVVASSIDTTLIAEFLGRFVTSPGAAIIAAGIAATAIILQLRHTKSQDKKQNWWTNFEWAAERAVPSSDANTALPVALSINILNALQDSADTDLQQRACGGLVTLLAESLGPTGRPEDHPETSQSTTKSEIREALTEYVTATVGSPARSRTAELVLSAERYESEVVRALTQLYNIGVIADPPQRANGSDPGYDTLVRLGDIDVLIEAKYFAPQYPPDLVSRRLRDVRAKARRDGPHKPLLIVNTLATLTPRRDPSMPTSASVKWDVGDSIDILASALKDVASVSGTETETG